MHTTYIAERRPRHPSMRANHGDIYVLHNGDWSGEAIIGWEGEGVTGEVRVPGWVAHAIVERDHSVLDKIRELLEA